MNATSEYPIILDGFYIQNFSMDEQKLLSDMHSSLRCFEYPNSFCISLIYTMEDGIKYHLTISALDSTSCEWINKLSRTEVKFCARYEARHSEEIDDRNLLRYITIQEVSSEAEETKKRIDELTKLSCLSELRVRTPDFEREKVRRFNLLKIRKTTIGVFYQDYEFKAFLGAIHDCLVLNCLGSDEGFCLTDEKKNLSSLLAKDEEANLYRTLLVYIDKLANLYELKYSYYVTQAKTYREKMAITEAFSKANPYEFAQKDKKIFSMEWYTEFSFQSLLESNPDVASMVQLIPEYKRKLCIYLRGLMITTYAKTGFHVPYIIYNGPDEAMIGLLDGGEKCYYECYKKSPAIMGTLLHLKCESDTYSIMSAIEDTFKSTSKYPSFDALAQYIFYKDNFDEQKKVIKETGDVWKEPYDGRFYYFYK